MCYISRRQPDGGKSEVLRPEHQPISKSDAGLPIEVEGGQDAPIQSGSA